MQALRACVALALRHARASEVKSAAAPVFSAMGVLRAPGLGCAWKCRCASPAPRRLRFEPRPPRGVLHCGVGSAALGAMRMSVKLDSGGVVHIQQRPYIIKATTLATGVTCMHRSHVSRRHRDDNNSNCNPHAAEPHHLIQHHHSAHALTQQLPLQLVPGAVADLKQHPNSTHS